MFGSWVRRSPNLVRLVGRLWGCPTTFMWVYRLGAEKAKRMLLTGDLITGKEAQAIGLIHKAVPASDLDAGTS